MMFEDEKQRQAFKDAYEYEKRLMKSDESLKTDKNSLILVGKQIWELSYKYEESDLGAYDHITSFLNNNLQNEYYNLLSQELLLPHKQISYMGSALWCHQGFPQITMGHKYAASLMATKLSDDILDFIKPPWRSFYIEIPNSMIFIYDSMKNREIEINGVLVCSLQDTLGQNKWAYVTVSNESFCALWRHGINSKSLLESNIKCSYDSSAFSSEVTNLDDKVIILLGRLILNVCLSMSDPRNVKPPKINNKKEISNKRGSSEPKVRNYVLGKTPNVDCRSAVQNFLRGNASSKEINVQVLVAGHWKQQSHGPNHSLKKIIWVEPYWRGPDDAPILLNQRVIK